jgi:monooxygenase
VAEHFDVVIVGAGISGIGAAYHLQANSPDRSYVMLESRERLGGTWDLFRYPGIRSDSDMYTLGFSFRPWTEEKAIADGSTILNYLDETVAENGIGEHIRYATRVTGASWSTNDALWTVTAERGGEEATFTCAFLFLCTGYYNYTRGHTPQFAGVEQFQGRVVHPQFWSPDIDYAGKRVVVIGSGATAVTLVPELAKQAAHVTMLQRSPTYIVSRPSQDGIANWLRKRLPAKAAYGLTRWKNVLLQQFFFGMMRKRPEKAKQHIVQMVRDELGPDYDVGTHFTPSYNPWDQRLCLVPDADLFAALRSGKAEVVTDTIERFTPTGIALGSGRQIEADLVVTATGLEIQLFSGMPILVDGKRFDPSQAMTYKGMMFADVPNFAISFGYTNASWTLKSDLTANYVTRLLNAMRKRGMRQVTPRIGAPVEETPFLEFTSGYVQRAAGLLPRQGTRKPWRLNQNYARDVVALKFGSIDQEMEFSNPEPRASKAA